MGRFPRLPIAIAVGLAACAIAAAQSTITGRLLQKRGDNLSPLPNCTVFASSIDNGPLVGEYPDSQGRFRLEFPPDSRVTVGTICPGYQVAEINGRRTVPPTNDCSTPGPCADLQLTLEPQAVIEGYIVDHNGMPVEQVSVELRQGAGPRARHRQTDSDDRGYFRFFHIPPGEYEIEPMIRGRRFQAFSWESDPQQVAVRPGDVLSLGEMRLRLVEPLELSGRITGLPPGTIGVFLTLDGRGLGVSLGQTVAVDGDGRFHLSNVPPGRYEVRMNLPEPDGSLNTMSPARLGPVDLRSASGEVVFTRSEPGGLQGTVQIDPPERDDVRGPGPNEPFGFRIVSDDGFEQWVQTNPPDHAFHLDNLEPGSYKLLLGPGLNVRRRAAGDEWEPIEALQIRAGEPAEVELRVRFEMGRLTVVVKPAPDSDEAANNKPAAHYVVGLRGDGPASLNPTDQNGRLVMRYIAAGDYEICAWRTLSPEQADDPETWRKAGDAVRKFRHEGEADMEITLTAAPGSESP
jgi:hypothetical protein